MINRLSWSEVDSDSLVGWLVKVMIGNSGRYAYMVVTEENRHEILGSWGHSEVSAIEDYIKFKKNLRSIPAS